MSLTEAQRKAQYAWQKKGTVMIAARLQRKADADIIEYLEDKPNATIIKAAIREYIKNHASAVQPTAEEEVENISAEEELEALYGDLPWDEKD